MNVLGYNLNLNLGFEVECKQSPVIYPLRSPRSSGAANWDNSDALLDTLEPMDCSTGSRAWLVNLSHNSREDFSIGGRQCVLEHFSNLCLTGIRSRLLERDSIQTACSTKLCNVQV